MVRGNLEHFQLGMRVRIVNYDGNPQFNGRTGVVRRITRAGDAAFIEVDGGLPNHARLFPEGDPRQDHAKVYLDECVDAAIENGVAQ